MNVIEKMALKISEGRDCREQASWCVAERGELCECRRQARVALAAALEDMETPSEGMVDAANEKERAVGITDLLKGANPSLRLHYSVAYQAMLAQYRKENLGDPMADLQRLGQEYDNG